MYQTSNRRALWEEWIQWTFYFSMCHDRLNDPLPLTFAVNVAPTALRTSLCRAKRIFQKHRRAHKPSVQPWVYRVKTEPTWTNTGTSFPTAGGLEPTRRSQWVLRNAYGKVRLSAKETVRDLWPQPCSFIGKYWRLRWHLLLLLLSLHPTAIQLFFALVFALYWALSLSDWTVHYTNVQGKNTAFTLYIFLKYIQSKISYWYFHELQPVCTSPVHLHLLTCMYERTGVQISVHVTHALTHLHKSLWFSTGGYLFGYRLRVL